MLIMTSFNPLSSFSKEKVFITQEEITFKW